MEEDTGRHTEGSSNSLSVVRDGPPLDDCCPICFGAFSVPCKGPCGHWYCGMLQFKYLTDYAFLF